MPASPTAFTGEIAMHGFNFAPTDWVFCNGSLYSIGQNPALYSLIGILYGGDGRVSFGLPNLNSRSPVGATLSGPAPGLEQFEIGQMAGREASYLQYLNMPAHGHTASFAATGTTTATASVEIYTSGADKATPEANDLAAGSASVRFRSPGGFGEPDKVENGGFIAEGPQLLGGTVTLKTVGKEAPVQTRSPVTALNFCICEFGVYPPRS